VCSAPHRRLHRGAAVLDLTRIDQLSETGLANSLAGSMNIALRRQPVERVDGIQRGLTMTDISPAPQLAGSFHRLGTHDQHPWKAMPWPGIHNKVLFFDRVSGATIELARVEKGATFPEHYHTTVQTLFLVSGRLVSGDLVIEPGTFNVIPAGQLHGPFHAEEESIQFKYFAATPVYIMGDGQTYIYRDDGSTTDAGNLDFVSRLSATNFIS
jgi:quercetin dioxygenase-like cupin family protein